MRGSVNRASIHREPAFWLVLLLAVAMYLPRLTTLTIRGEESRRAVIAREMIKTGDWIVPRTQGEVRLSRPPLQNWMIAGLAVLAGEMDAWSIRLPGVMATVLTVGLVYWSARQTLSITGAVVAAAAYASFFHVLELGGTGETEPVFTLLVAASLLLWHGLFNSSRHTLCAVLPSSENARQRHTECACYYWAWTLGGACAGLAMLTKGLQAPLYFFGSTWAYLLLTRQYRALFQPSHFVGLASFAVVVGSWQAAFMWQMGIENGWMIYFWNVAERFNDNRTSTYLVHFLTYPPSVVFGCLMPWSVLLLAYLHPQVRSNLGPRRDQAVFMVTSILICLPSVWLPPEARPRYFMPLFPCFAILVGIAGEILYEHAGERVGQIWINFARIAGWLFGATAVALPLTSLLWPASPYAIPLWQSAATAIALLIAAVVIRNSLTLAPQPGMTRAAFAIAAGLGVIHVGPFLTVQQQRSENLPAAVAALEVQLPRDVQLVSFDHVHHVFLYYYGRDVKLLPWPQSAADVPGDVNYFCVEVRGNQVPELPFLWDEVASLPVDRHRRNPPRERVVVGKRRAESRADVVQSASPVRL